MSRDQEPLPHSIATPTSIVACSSKSISAQRREAMAAGEIESVESLLDSAGERALNQHELSELKRVLYGNPAK